MMRALIQTIRRFGAAREGVAVVEFALILPVMLLLYIGTMEASALISMDRRVQTITGTIGDLVARADERITEAQLQDYFLAAQHILAPFLTDGLVQTVTLVSVAADGDTNIEWSRKFVSGSTGHVAGHTEDEPYELPSQLIDIARDNYVVVSEAQYPYTPLTGLVFDQVYPLYRENFYLPRFGEGIAYDGS